MIKTQKMAKRCLIYYKFSFSKKMSRNNEETENLRNQVVADIIVKQKLNTLVKWQNSLTEAESNSCFGLVWYN